MIFITLEDILSKIDQDTLNDITDDNDAYIEAAEIEAISEMTSSLNVRYDTELIFSAIGTDRNAEVVMRCVDIAIYHMHTRIAPDNVPELREIRYKNAQNWCDKVADGFINPLLPSKQTADAKPIRSGNSKPKDDNYF